MILKKIITLHIKQIIVFTYLVISNSWFTKILRISKEPSKKFVIISRSRTGSTMLIRQLRKVPNSIILGEILGRSKNEFIWEKIKTLIYKNHFCFFDFVGFKLFYYHPVDNEVLNNEIFEEIENDQSIMIIHLVRDNLLDVLLSKEIASRTDHWSKKNKAVKLEKFFIDSHSFEKEVRLTIDMINKTHQRFLKRTNYLLISYEEILSNKALRIIEQKMDLEKGVLGQVNTEGFQNSRDKHQLIINYDELKSIYEEQRKAININTK